MILATSSGWLIAVEKLSETTHTVTVQDRGEVAAPYTVSKSDPDQRLFDNTDEASAWIDDHPARKEPSHDNQ